LPGNLFSSKFLIVFPINNEDFERNKYRTELLKMILNESKVEYEIFYFQTNDTNPQIVEKLKRGIITIATLGASKIKEKELIPIRIPIYKGLLGYRIFLINKNDQYKFNKIQKIDDLKNLTGVQGVGWTDLKILRDAGLPQIEMPRKIIYKILNIGGRVDYFGRAINEAIGEFQSLKIKYPNIAIENKILLVYPFAMYFYVSPKYPELAEKLRKGFQLLFNSGKFDRFFYNNSYIISTVKKAKIKYRIRFNLPNRYLSEKTKALGKKYWFDINKRKKWKYRTSSNFPTKK
jgi:hypothetical protein